MENNFWQELNKKCKKSKQPILALAPMAGITDSPFRQMCKEYGADVVYSEMASTTALVYNPRKTLEMLVATPKESPYVIQLFGSNLDHFAQAARLLTDENTLKGLKIKDLRKPDGLDINFGCPAKKVQKQGAGAVLMNDLELAKNIIIVTLKNTDLPVSIKCRSQVGNVSVIDFLKKIKDLNIAALMIHGRSLAQGHSGPVDWKIIKEARKYFKGVIIANGGVKNYSSGKDLLELSGADGLGIGQGALGKPWLFEQIKNPDHKAKSDEDIYRAIIKHAQLVEKMKGSPGIVEFRKQLCWYIKGSPGAKELREKFVKVENFADIEKILKNKA